MLLDTHVVLWSGTDNPKLGRKARALIYASNLSNPFYVSAVTAWEIALLTSRSRLNLGVPAKNWLENAMKHPAWRSIAIDDEIAIESVNLPGEFHNDPADRFLVATARINGFSLLTADGAILEYGKAGYLNAIDASL